MRYRSFLSVSNINKPLIGNSIGASMYTSLAFKFLLFWIFVSIGRPQDIFPSIAILHLGDIAAIGVLISFLFVQPNQTNERILGYKETRLIILFFILMIVSVPFATVKTDSFNFIQHTMVKIFIFHMCLVKLIRTIKEVNFISSALVFSMLSLSIATFLAREDTLIRASIGTMYDPNDLAMVIVTILPIAMMYGFHSKGTERLFGIVSSIIGILVITLTQSRGGFIGLIAIAFLIFFSRSRFKIKYLIILLLLGVMFVRFASTEYTDRISTITGGDDGGSGRTLVWKRSLRMISSNPFGYGVDNFQSAYGRYIESDPNTANLGSGAYSWKTAHNSFILIAVELGVLGLAIFIFLIYKTYNNFRKIKKTFKSDTIIYRQAEFFRISLVGFLVCAFFLSQSYSEIFLLIIAVSSVMINVIAKEMENDRDIIT